MAWYSKAVSKVKSVASKAVSAVKKGVTNLKTTLSPSVKSYTSNTVGGQKVAALNQINPNINLKSTGGQKVAALNTAYNPNINYSSPGGQKVAAANLNPATNYTSLSKNSGGDSNNVSSLSRSGTASVVAPGVSTTNTVSSPTYNEPVNVAALSTPTSPINLPSAPSAGLSLPTAASNLMNVGATDASGAPIVADPTQTQETDKYQKMIEQSLAGMMGNAPERTDNGRAAAMESSGYNQALREANDLSNQISAINADTEAKKLSLIGQGRGIPEAIIGGQQAKLDREAAIKTMPLTAQYKAAVGLVEAAKEIVNNFVADERAYQSSLQQWQNNVYQATYQYASAQQKQQLDAQKALTDRQYELEDNFLQQQTDLFKFALENGKGYLGSRIMKTTNMDDLSAIASELGTSNETSKVTDTPMDIEEQIANLKLTTGQKGDLVDIDVLQSQIGRLQTLASDGLEGIGALGIGSTKQALFKIFGKGSQEGAEVRTTIGNIKGQIAKLRGGTSFTTNEEKLLNSYVPGINESTESVVAKLNGLNQFLQSKKDAIIRVGGGTVQTQKINTPEDLRAKYNY